jgi:hypothetical protein
LIRNPSVSFGSPGERYSQGDEQAFRAGVERAFAELAQFFQSKGLTSTPAALAIGDNDDYDAGYFVTCLRITPDVGASALAGLKSGYDLRRVTIINLGAANLTIKHEDAGSSAENRFTSPTGADVVLGANDVAEVQYDSASQRWRIVNVQA